MTTNDELPVVLYVGRFDSTCGKCKKPASLYDNAHTTPIGYHPEPGCGAVWTHVFSTYSDKASEEATRRIRPDLIYVTFPTSA